MHHLSDLMLLLIRLLRGKVNLVSIIWRFYTILDVSTNNLFDTIILLEITILSCFFILSHSCILLYCTVLYCTVLYCIALYCIVLYYNVIFHNILLLMKLCFWTNIFFFFELCFYNYYYDLYQSHRH